MRFSFYIIRKGGWGRIFGTPLNPSGSKYNNIYRSICQAMEQGREMSSKQQCGAGWGGLPMVHARLNWCVWTSSSLLCWHNLRSMRYTSTLQCFTNMPCSITWRAIGFCGGRTHHPSTYTTPSSCYLVFAYKVCHNRPVTTC